MPKPKSHATRVAFVTGAASGIGKAIAERLAAEGACVIVADLDADKSRQVAEGIGGADVAIGVGVDVADGEAVATALQEAILADRKSTRLNSSHVSISYDVFCLT